MIWRRAVTCAMARENNAGWAGAHAATTVQSTSLPTTPHRAATRRCHYAAAATSRTTCTPLRVCCGGHHVTMVVFYCVLFKRVAGI